MIHRFWHNSTPPHPIIDEYVNNKYQVRDWGMHDVPMPISGVQDKRHLANLLRLMVLWTYGGIWIDHDVIPIIDLESLPKPFAAATGSINSCIMGFPPGHPMLYNALDEAYNHPHGNSIIERSGSVLLHRHLTPDVQLISLPFDSLGHPIPGAPLWAFHLFDTSYSNMKGQP